MTGDIKQRMPRGTFGNPQYDGGNQFPFGRGFLKRLENLALSLETLNSEISMGYYSFYQNAVSKVKTVTPRLKERFQRYHDRN